MENIKNLAPSRKIIAFFVIPFLAVIVFFVLKNIYFTENKTIVIMETGLLQELQENLNQDTDGDGLWDWEERLYQTNITMEDTDGDGLSDAFEITTGTDPLDFLNMKSMEEEHREKKEQAKKIKTVLEEKTMTDKVAQELLAVTQQLSQSNLIFNKSAQAQATGMILDKSKLNFENKYTKADLNISKTLTPDEFLKSFVDLTQSLSRFIESYNLSPETDLLILYFQTNNRIYLEELKNNLEIQELLLKKNLELEIPEKISDDWLRYINLLNNTVDIIEIFIDADQDAMTAIAALTIYNGVVLETIAVIEKIGLSFQE